MKPANDPLRRTNPRLAEIREMRAEVRRLDQALLIVEGQAAQAREPQMPLNLRAVKGWVLSIVESHIFLTGYNESKFAQKLLILELRHFVHEQQMRFQSETTGVGRFLGGL